ncbi:bcl-2/adenovirus E1B 19 kDa-interacting protein 2-like protein isoform X5 [Nerophis ophidion]|uniref:bcl-2/adenovirus E1B 19 kDa-interacting protein 2-like protein isoform X5 n=1 Tax=Nerophis ophidion TaxID=159077 RepID=UPI002AE019B4|nr:bcl-2/adenovirus E1B 19 kDa-interacting protein 2-like protein isoform X5 [Nerophis ophidion]
MSAVTTLSRTAAEREEDSSVQGCSVAMETRDTDSADQKEERVEDKEEEEEREEDKKEEDTGGGVGEETSSRATAERPSTLPISMSCGVKKKRVLAAPALSVSLGRSESGDFHSAFLSPSPGDQDDGGLDFDLDAMETPSDSESLRFPTDDLDLEVDVQGGSVLASPHTGSLLDSEQGGLGALEREDVVDNKGTRWRAFTVNEPPQERRVNMSVLEPFLKILSHGGYYGDGMNDIIVISSCYLPENGLENYQYVMDNLFRLRKNLKGVYVVHPTWSIKALITIIKPFISSKFSRKLQFVSSLQDLAALVPTEHVQIPDCVRLYDHSLSS